MTRTVAARIVPSLEQTILKPRRVLVNCSRHEPGTSAVNFIDRIKFRMRFQDRQTRSNIVPAWLSNRPHQQDSPSNHFDASVDVTGAANDGAPTRVGRSHVGLTDAG